MLIFLANCGSNDASHLSGKLHVYAGIPPIADLVSIIGGDLVDVDILLRPGSDPHTFEPSPRQLLELYESDMFFSVGIPFEGTLTSKIESSNPGLQIVDVSQGVTFRAIETGEDGHHHHDAVCSSEEHHEHDPHIWLSPPLLKVIARNIAEALILRDPEHEQGYRENLTILQANLDDIHDELSEQLAPYSGRTFYVFHPAFGYFGDAYGLKQRAVEFGGKTPTSRHLESLIHQAREEDVHIVFVQPQFDPSSAKVIAKAIDGAVVPLDSLSSDLLDSLRDIANKLEEALSTKN